jgi:hypothetical protein
MNPNSPLAPSPLLRDEPASGLDCSGDFKAAPDIRQSGPAAGGGYVLRAGPKVKVVGTEELKDRLQRAGTGSVKIKGLAGRSGRARTCDPRFWRFGPRVMTSDGNYWEAKEVVKKQPLPPVFSDGE